MKGTRRSTGRQTHTPKLRIRTGDTVAVISGKDRGKTGPVLAAMPHKGRVLVEGVHVVQKHIRPRRAGEKGQRVSVAAPLPVSNVQLVCPACKKRTRVAIDRTDGERRRMCKKCAAIV
ncbi:MAG: 50S ribosomal protein L24 [Candidatus Andersenbacteria bacterium CG10_big_fil_rev_8_21_14_0_10_54_11]|uniref:Large ribosomal subunit protein uL24 n=1 Tax=Candidatus Andersenbacteria bacterium CG10_big_fil_rev_8_21_14_0_10_54_11 TaxID=1974485 RepID=A0A2M6WYV9_9BACT|nr:MAG: 50S ribosomal protein L24 [Candidatus Andersenbacteria bacterium CG10_big_fil_rev_8_21_14_0_10_54_11]